MGKGDFPGGAVDKNPPASTGDAGSVPGPGRVHTPHGSQAQAPQLLSLCAESLCSATSRRLNEECARHNEVEPPHQPQGPRAAK